MKRVLLVLLVISCKERHEPQMREPVKAPPAAAANKHDAIARADFNRFAVRQNLPVFWIADTNHDNAIDPNETAALLFYPTTGHWVENGAFTKEFEDAYQKILDAAMARQSTDPRIALVARDLDQGRATLIHTPVPDHKLLDHMVKIATMIDELYELQDGAHWLAHELPPDPESRSLFRRNRGPKCVAPETESNKECFALPVVQKVIIGVYPQDIQKSDGFCKELEARTDAKTLLTPFTVVRGEVPKLEAVPYTTPYASTMTAIADELDATAKDAGAGPLADYLTAAAGSFRSNDWNPADEAWAKMNVDNSQYYVRVGPDEVYWEPCAHKAGFHLTFAKINQGSREWQKKLVPVQQEMESAIAALAGPPYAARKVTFHLPDFIDVIFNAGDDRTPLGATIGQSLPNWGPVANEGRGRTVAMVNFYADPDSREARHSQAASMLDADSMKLYSGEQEPGLLVTILHEATHNLGPAHEYKVGGKTDGEVFGGPLASVLEELKAQTGGIYLIEFLRSKGLITDDLARQAYADAIVWAFGHISQGMYTGTGERKTYGNVAAIQIGYLIEHGALSANPDGTLKIHADQLVPVINDMMKTVAGIKARGDKAGATALISRYVDDKKIVPHDTIAERFLRFPKASFVYSLE